MTLQPKYQYFAKFKADLAKRQKEITHTLFIGASTSGKNYLAFWMAEFGLAKKQIKLWYPWVIDWQHLEEVCALMYPSRKPINNFKLSKHRPVPGFPQYPIRIYIPVSEKAPKEIFPGLIVPFTVSIDNLNEECLQLICGTTDCSAQYSEYKQMSKSGTSWPQLKLNFLKANKQLYTEEKGFVKEKWTMPFKAQHTVIQGLMRRLGAVDQEGILAHKNFPFALEKFMEQEIKDRETIPVLYLGGIKNENLRRLIFLYFLETMRSALERNGGERFKYKHCIYINELETLVSPTNDKEASPVDMVINKYMLKLISVGRHVNIEIWSDCKSPNLVDVKVLKLFHNSYITKIDDLKDIRRIGELSHGFNEQRLKKYVSHLNNMTRKAYRFIDMNRQIPDWRHGRKLNFGYELFQPRVTMDDKVNMKYNSFATWNGKTTEKLFGLKKTMTMMEIKKQIRDIWRPDDDKIKTYIEDLKAKKDEKQTKTNKNKEIEERLKKIKEYVLQGWTEAQIVKELGISNSLYYKNKSQIDFSEEELITIKEKQAERRKNQGVVIFDMKKERELKKRSEEMQT